MPTVLDDDPAARSREFVHRFWNGEADWCRAALADGFTWIGPREGQYGLSPDLFEEDLARMSRSAPRVILMDEAYEPVVSDGGLSVVTGQYLAYTSPDLSAAFAARQRLTFVWTAGEKGLRLAHLHVSNPLRPARTDDAAGPGRGRSTQETYRYLSLLSSQKGYRASHAIRDVSGATHMVRLFDVVYLEACRQSTNVHCLARTFRVRAGIAGLARTLMGGSDTGSLVCVHRSFYVNALYVDTVGADGLTLTDGTSIPVSVRRRTEVCDEIARARSVEE